MPRRHTNAAPFVLAFAAALILGLAACSPSTPVSPSTPPATPLATYYVDPGSGLDTNPGTAAEPLKTLGKALSLVASGQTVVLEAGTYDEASGESWGYSVPANVTLQAASSGVVLASTAGASALQLDGSASLTGLTFQGFVPALMGATGTVAVKDVTFTNDAPAVQASGDVALTLDAATFDGTGSGVKLLNAATATVTGGSFSGLDGASVAAFDTSAASLDSVQVTGTTATVVALHQSAVAVLSHCVITNSSPQGVPNNASLEVSDSGVLTLDNTSVGGSDGWAVLALDPTTTVAITGGTFSGNNNTAIESSGTLSIDGATVSNNAGSGIVAANGSLSVTNTTVSGHPYVGISVATGVPVTMRGSSLLSNAGGILLVGLDGQTDLGTAASPGGNTFQNGTSQVGVTSFRTFHTVSAVGNTWIPNVQGADGSGHYGSQLVTGAVTGANYTLPSGASLQF